MKKFKVFKLAASLFCLFPFALSAQDLSWEQPMKTRLLQMVDSLTTNLKPWLVPNKVFRVEQFGAKGDSVTLNTIAIQKAVDKCSAKGGGVVLFSKGNYVSGTIVLKSGVMLEIAQGARLLGSVNLNDYPEMIEQFKSVMSENHKFRQSLIYAEKASKIGIRGKGEIYFRGEKVNFPGKQTTGAIIGRPFGIRMIECSKVVMQDIYLHNSAAWMQSYIYCNDLIFDGITVLNQANFNNDGLDPDGCSNMIIRNCTINSEDDAMCLKGASNKPTQNVLIENSTFYSTCNAFKYGTDNQGDFKNVVARNLVLGGVPNSGFSLAGHQASSGITLSTVDGGNLEGIYMKDITINQTRCPIFLRIGSRLRTMPNAPTPKVGKLEKVIIENVTGKDNFIQGSLITGVAASKIENIVLRNIHLSMEGGGTTQLINASVPESEKGYPDSHQFLPKGLPSYGFYIRHAKNIYFDNVKTTAVKNDLRPEFFMGVDVENVLIAK